MFDEGGRGRRFRLAELPPEPEEFPCEPQLRVIVGEVPPGTPSSRMRLGNNYLQAGAWVQVIDFVPPTPEGDEGVLRAWCDSPEELEELRRFLQEPHGSSLASLDSSGQWHVSGLDDDGDPADEFPQTVTFRIVSFRDG